MERANDGGWDFIKVGGKYVVYESPYIYDITVIKDKSNAERYEFYVSSIILGKEFTISHAKNPGGYYSGMLKISSDLELLPKNLNTDNSFR